MQLIAHRGGAGFRIENTLAAFANAITLGADGAELDVHLTRDGNVVVHHDDRLNAGYCRRGDGAWVDASDAPRIADLTFAELQDYEIGAPRAGSAYARQFDRVEPVAGQRIPRLRDVIRLAKDRSTRFVLVIEIKSEMLAAARRPWRALLDATLDVIASEDFAARSILCSFDWGALVAARRTRSTLVTWFTTPPLSWFGYSEPEPDDLPPDKSYLRSFRALHAGGAAPWFGGFDPRRFKDSYPGAIAEAGGSAWFMYHRDSTPERVRDCAAQGLSAAAWSANLRDRTALCRLVNTGIEAVCLDYPGIGPSALETPDPTSARSAGR